MTEAAKERTSFSFVKSEGLMVCDQGGNLNGLDADEDDIGAFGGGKVVS